MSMSQVFAVYLEYLTKWNKSDSLIMILDQINEMPEYIDDEDLPGICHCEWVDAQSLTNDKVLSVKEFLQSLYVSLRDKKIDDIIN